ncbi:MULTISPECIES: 3-hydroxyacyl-CoA dehydrogenase [Sutcliffiella]|uniref:3-hydroxybutyryl-CoA dehydrogenase n=1 Tax=Sutcliffiella cohnii TaxID=33932 RepID=A0A223KQX3_9BACI|nr:MULTISPECIES: 3-hydroxyacyl-CoA dehydrogenase [Sutcliffiella]AST91787.1 3-hydroxybutyryl-CoA dehydrogenase [Sutcliffiella cohnii]MED4018589.1 3-hydroxyacyl-CoA dehydrogenase [Sutcliffiella cohnii]WBL13007.1 3-hydroxyacyl-CoA dehydrogenase [Sutcliffiella sp. NC1]
MINNIVVVGSGVMGRGIAYVAAVGGFHTTLVDIKEEQLRNAKHEIEAIFTKSVERGKISQEIRKDSSNRLNYSIEMELVIKEADLIIEAVPEKIEIKKNVFETFDKKAPPSCIFATNTSTMSPTEIGSFTSRPDKVIAMHFFNPVHKMKLVEIVRGLETSESTAEEIRNVAEKMGKETVVVNEFPGFVTSRISALVGNEAFYMLQEGVGTPEEIDKAIKLGLNYPMGPFELGDLVGLDVRLNNLKYLHEKLGEKYRPAPLLEKYVKAGRLGRKSGKGVYDYTNRD